MRCYNCGIALEADQNHREHIPARNLYDGFPNDHKNNRILVPACYTCNQSFSPLDEEFRNFIGVINKHPEAAELTEKTTRSMNRWDSRIARVIYSVFTKKPYAVQFNINQIESIHVKNFKGLFYHNYKYPIPSNYKILAHFDKNFQTEKSQKLINYLTSNFSFKVSGHENVFRYILQPFRSDYTFDGNDIPPSDNERFFLAILSYTKNHAALVLAERSGT